ncbi:hypothetical protein ACHAWT_011112 [Skeletonema menzelii]|eukprot:scaffold1663_cov158-Skeletonema_menzelii.AAC.1
MATMKRRHPDGIALEAVHIIKNSNGSLGDAATSSESIDHLFITMCFYARLGFVQPPSCLKCAHHKSTKKGNERNTNSGTSCNNLVPWRRDANKPLHPDGLGDNLVFVTCETAKSLIRGDAYPSIQWDNKNRRILHEM